jgi:integrase
MVHRVRGCTVLLPGDLRDLGEKLVGADRQGFQIYVMILLGIKLFLRASELISIRMEDFRERLYIVNDDRVRGISIAVDGKSDYGTQYLYIWEDEECPEFCPLRHLLVYMATTGITEGYLFPYFKKHEKIQDKVDTPWVYSQWRTKIRTLVLRHCSSKMNPDPDFDEPIKIGTHTLRKTGYLFSVFGIMRYNGASMSDRTRSVENSTAALQMANVLKSARHSTVQNAAVYLQDIGTMYDAIQKE